VFSLLIHVRIPLLRAGHTSIVYPLRVVVRPHLDVHVGEVADRPDAVGVCSVVFGVCFVRAFVAHFAWV
jgi:hypothetical protein